MSSARAARWGFIAAVLVTAVGLVLPFSMGGGAEPLKDRHSDPGTNVAIATVAVTSEGKLYHDPRCTFIHGSATLEPTPVAISRGLSPCPRCLGVLRARSAPAAEGMPLMAGVTRASGSPVSASRER